MLLRGQRARAGRGLLPGSPTSRQLEPLVRIDVGNTIRCQFDREPVPGLSVILDAGEQGEQHMGRDELGLILKRAEELWNSIIANV